jgi:hypothetical protein
VRALRRCAEEGDIVSEHQLSDGAMVALSAALRDRSDVSRAFLVPLDGSIVVEFRETADDVDAYREDLRELMLIVIESLGDEAKGRSLKGGPAENLSWATRGAVLLYERVES